MSDPDSFVGFDFDTIWEIDDALAHPVFRRGQQHVTFDPAGGTCAIESQDYTIGFTYDYLPVTDGYEGKYFKLGNDITYSHETDWNDVTSTENNYEAIGGNGHAGCFRGDFDGNNKTISGIRIYGGYSQGLFGETDLGANIHDLTLADVRITGEYKIGGIVSNNRAGTITRCHVLNTVAIHLVVDHANNVGGIVGYNGDNLDDGAVGTVSHCTSAATITIADGVTGCQYYGAIAGFNDRDGTLQRNYYANCTVAGMENANGVGCGYIDDGNGGYISADVTENNGAMPLSVGDANGDGQVTITDAVAIVNYILGNASANFNLFAADVNRDGNITITDAVGVVNIILGNGGGASAPQVEMEEPGQDVKPE